MKKQTFRAKSMTEAMEVVKRALGPEAVIISVRPAPIGPAWKVWQPPGVEVIAVGGGKGETISPEAAALMASQMEAETAAKEDESAAPKHLGSPDKKAVNRQAFQAALRRTGAGKAVDDTQVVPAGEAGAEPGDLPPFSPEELISSAGATDRSETAFDPGPFAAPAPPAEHSGVSPEAHEAAVQTAKLISQMVADDPKKAAQLNAFLKKKAAERSGPAPDLAESSAPRRKETLDETLLPDRTAEAQTESRSRSRKPLEKIDLPLSLNTPKPKLAIDELAAALRSPEKGSAGREIPEEKPGERPPYFPAERFPQTPAQKPGQAPGEKRLQPPAERILPFRAGIKTPAEEVSSEKVEDDAPASAPAARPKPRPARPVRIETPLDVSAGVFIPSALPAPLAIAYDTLARQGVDAALLEKTIRSCAEALSPQTLTMPDTVQEYIQRMLEGNLRTFTAAQLHAHPLICVVGPSGAGKTSLTAKLAAHAVREKGGQVIWVSADTVRTGAIAETGVFADLLGVRQYLVYTPEELEEIAAEMTSLAESGSTTLLVDTPACNPYSEASLVEMGSFLNALPQRTTYLTVPATAKEADLHQIQAAFSIFKIDGLVVTKMDETRTIGSVYNLAWRSQIPLAYFTTGSRLLEDLHPADGKIFTGALFRTP